MDEDVCNVELRSSLQLMPSKPSGELIKAMLKAFFDRAGLAFILLLLALHHTAAWSDQDQCRDVLLQGTKSQQLYSSYEFYRQLVNAHFLKIDSETSQKDTSLTASVPIYGVVVGGSYDESKYRYFKETIRQSLAIDTLQMKFTDILLESGDAEILKAWTTCMVSRGGLSIRFDNVTAKKASLRVEWFDVQGFNQVRMADDIKFPRGVKVVAGEHCTKRNYRITHGNSCLVQLEFDDARTDALITVYSDGHGSVAAYLPPRMKAEKEVRPYQPGGRTNERGCESQGPTPFTLMSPPRRAVSALAVFCSNDGWFFDIETSRAPTRGINGYSGNPLQLILVDLVFVAGTKVSLNLRSSNSSPDWYDAQTSADQLVEMRYVVVPWDAEKGPAMQRVLVRPI